MKEQKYVLAIESVLIRISCHCSLVLNCNCVDFALDGMKYWDVFVKGVDLNDFWTNFEYSRR